MGRSAAAVIVTTTVLACFSGTSLIAQDAAKTDEKPGPKRIELTEPGVYTESDCTYVMTRDVTAKGCGFTFEGKNVVVDLGGHTLTFNTEPYRPTFPPKASPATRGMWTPPFGICFKRDSENVELRNGTIIQGAGRDKDVRGVFIRAKRANIHHTTTVISDDHGSNFLAWWAGSDVELHHNYIVNNAVAESGWSKGVNLQEAGTHWNIHHNTIVGGHQGILVNGRREKEGVHIHHNWIQHKRTPGQKVPQAMRIRASGCAIDHNEIVSIDGRGIQPVRPNNHWHHNVVDVRYTLKAKGGFYPENRCYGYWARGANTNGSRIEHNLFVVNNEVVGDRTSSTIGVLLCTDGGPVKPLSTTTVIGNRIVVRHNDKAQPARGLTLQNTGDRVIIRDNYIWADTLGVLVDDRTRGPRIEGNTFVRPNAQWQMKTAWERGSGEGLKSCVFKDNKIVDPPSDKEAPAAPKGLTITRRINGCELHWDANAEDDVLGYYVHRDGKRVEDRMKCGRFYVDLSADPKGKFEYAVSAVDLAGNEGPKCPPVSTAPAK